MKYFTLSEALLAFLAAILLGVIFGLGKIFISALISALSRLSLVKEYLKARLKSKKYEFPKTLVLYSEKTRAGFVISEVVNVVLILVFSIALPVLLYLTADGVLRVYLTLGAYLSFYFFVRFFERRLSGLAAKLAVFLCRPIFFIVFILILIPYKIFKSVKERRRKQQK